MLWGRRIGKQDRERKVASKYCVPKQGIAVGNWNLTLPGDLWERLCLCVFIGWLLLLDHRSSLAVVPSVGAEQGLVASESPSAERCIEGCKYQQLEVSPPCLEVTRPEACGQGAYL